MAVTSLRVKGAQIAAIVMLATTLLASACSQETAIPAGLGPCVVTDGSTCTTHPLLSSGGSSSCGTLTSSIAACETCLTASCCSVLSTCSSNASCIALDECESTCATGDDACEQSCANVNPNGVGDLEAALDCESSECEAACSGTTSDAGTAACGFSSSNATCETCLETDCCTQASTCSSSADCSTIVTCVAACASNDTACQTSCVQASPAGSAAYNSFTQCMSADCASACQ